MLSCGSASMWERSHGSVRVTVRPGSIRGHVSAPVTGAGGRAGRQGRTAVTTTIGRPAWHVLGLDVAEPGAGQVRGERRRLGVGPPVAGEARWRPRGSRRSATSSRPPGASTRWASATPASTSCQWWTVAIDHSTVAAPSATGSASAVPSTYSIAPRSGTPRQAAGQVAHDAGGFDAGDPRARPAPPGGRSSPGRCRRRRRGRRARCGSARRPARRRPSARRAW